MKITMTRAKAMMMAQGLTAVKLAEKSGVNRSNLTLRLNGYGTCSKAVCSLVSDALGWEGDPMRVFDMVTLVEVAE